MLDFFDLFGNLISFARIKFFTVFGDTGNENTGCRPSFQLVNTINTSPSPQVLYIDTSELTTKQNVQNSLNRTFPPLFPVTMATTPT